MKIVVTLEANRVMVSNLDLDKNPFLYELKSNREPNYMVLNSQLYVQNLNAYVGDMVQLIRYERPAISVATNIFNHLTDPEYTYTESNGRKWNATLLTAVILKRVISKIEEAVTSRISEVSFVVNPQLQKSQTSRELKTALSYHKQEPGRLFNHSSALLAYYDHRHALVDKKVLIVYADGYDYYIQVIDVQEKKYLQLSLLHGHAISKNKIEASIREVVVKHCTGLLDKVPSTSRKNDLVIDNLVQEVYRAFFIKQKDKLNKPVFLDSLPCIVKLKASDFATIIGKFKDQLSLDIVKCLDQAHVSYEDIFQLYGAGEIAAIHPVAETIKSLFPGWETRYIHDDHAIAKGAALLLYMAGQPYNISLPPKKKTKDNGTVSLIRVKVPDGEEYIVFDKDAGSNYTSLTVNLAAYEAILDDSDEIVFDHIIDQNGQRQKMGEIVILHDVDIYPAQMQLNIIRSQQVYKSIQAIDFENDQILTVKYHKEGRQQEEQRSAEDTVLEVASSDQVPIRILPKTSTPTIQIKSKGRAKVKLKENAVGGVAIATKPANTADKTAIKIKKPSNKKVKIEIKNDEIKDKFEEIIEIIMINNSK